MTGPTKGLGGVGMEVGGTDMEEEVKEAYEVVKRIGMCLNSQFIEIVAEKDLIHRGNGDMGYGWKCLQWAGIPCGEPDHCSGMRDRLGTARNVNEMFRVFNALFVRPKACFTIESPLQFVLNKLNRFVVPSKNIKFNSSIQWKKISIDFDFSDMSTPSPGELSEDCLFDFKLKTWPQSPTVAISNPIIKLEVGKYT